MIKRTSISALLFREPITLLVESLKCKLFLISPLEFNVVLEFLMALRLGLYLSPVLVLRILSKKGTEPFLGKPCTWVVKAGCEAFLGIIGLNSLSDFSISLVSSIFFLLFDLVEMFFKSILPLLLVAPLEECSCTFTSDIVGRVGTVGTGVKGVPLILK